MLHPLDQLGCEGFAAEEEVCILFAEGGEATVGVTKGNGVEGGPLLVELGELGLDVFDFGEDVGTRVQAKGSTLLLEFF